MSFKKQKFCTDNVIIRFDGGPKCTNNQLQRCEVCYADYVEMMLRNRAETETKNFARLREEASLHAIYKVQFYDNLNKKNPFYIH